MSARPVLVTWQDHVCGLAYSGAAPFDHPRHRHRLLAFSVAFSLTGRGMTGADCWLTPSLLERVPRRTAYRYLDVLVTHKLVEQTATPARGRDGRKGRAARYRLLVPENACQNPARTWHTSAVSELAHVRAQPTTGTAASVSTNVCQLHARTLTRRSCPPVLVFLADAA